MASRQLTRIQHSKLACSSSFVSRRTQFKQGPAQPSFGGQHTCPVVLPGRRFRGQVCAATSNDDEKPSEKKEDVTSNGDSATSAAPVPKPCDDGDMECVVASLERSLDTDIGGQRSRLEEVIKVDTPEEAPTQRIRKRDRLMNLVRRFTGPSAPSTVDVAASEAAEELLKAEGSEATAAEKAELGTLISKTVRAQRGELVEEGDDGIMGEELEAGWEKRGNGSSLRRNVEVWRVALKCVLRSVKARKGDSADKTAAAELIRDSLLTLGPTFVKLGQVISTRTDVLSPEYITVLKSLQDDVPGFSGERAKSIVEAELRRPLNEVFQDFSDAPIAAASLGQVHTAMYKGKKVAIKVQRAGLKELFDVDLKNLKKLATLLDKFDPKSDGADREWASIYDESAKLLYKEIDYLNEADNADRFAADFKEQEWVRVPCCYREVSTPKVLVMEYVDSFKLTDIKAVEAAGLDRKLLAKRTADSFLRQIVETGYFHCDPHPGNLCVNKQGQLVFYDYGMMDELKPNVREGFREFCIALFRGGPFADDITVSSSAKDMVSAVEKMGVLAKGADRLASAKLARFFIRNFKNIQQGKKGANIKTTIGSDLLTLTDDKGGTVFRFPSTFTFIFRAFASIDGIGKGLDPQYDIGKLAQPFIEVFTATSDSGTDLEKFMGRFGQATGLNPKDINTAVTTPRKIAYLEETIREMEQGNLKIRVRCLENERALERLSLSSDVNQALLIASLLVSVGLATEVFLVSTLLYAGASGMGLKALLGMGKVSKFDKKQAKYNQQSFDQE